MTHDTPGSALSPRTMTRRGRSHSPAILATSSWGPTSASTAAHCAIDDGFDVTWLWTSVIARMIARGPAAKPIRQPVIAYAFEQVFTTIVRAFTSGPKDATETGRPSNVSAS